MAWSGGPQTLLCFVFLIGAAGALTAGPWQAVVPELVPKEHMPPAVALNSMGVNVSRALGSALGGVQERIRQLSLEEPLVTHLNSAV